MSNPIRLEWRSPSELAENPKNWRKHPRQQMAALNDVIGQVGWAGACLYNERTKRLIDGHARRQWAIEHGEDRVPVLIGSWSDDEEAAILISLDPLAAMAMCDSKALSDLMDDVSVGSSLDSFLAQMAEQNEEKDPQEGWGKSESRGIKRCVAMLAMYVDEIEDFEAAVKKASFDGERPVDTILRALRGSP